MSEVTTTGPVSLREYQLALSERLQSVGTGSALASKLGLQVGRENWLIDLADAAEVIPIPALFPVPLARGWFAGVASVRGNLYSVTDLSGFLGGGPLKLSPEARLVVLSERFRCGAALLVARSLGLRAAETLKAHESAGRLRWVRAHYSDMEDRPWKELDVQALVNDEAFLEVST
jgi:twitching motility protein PilI